MIDGYIILFHLRSCIQYNWRLYSHGFSILFRTKAFREFFRKNYSKFIYLFKYTRFISGWLNITSAIIALRNSPYQNSFSDFAFSLSRHFFFLSERIWIFCPVKQEHTFWERKIFVRSYIFSISNLNM